MKDALGHGSSGFGAAFARQRAGDAKMFGGGQPIASNAQAASVLNSGTSKSDSVQTHPAMTSGTVPSRRYDDPAHRGQGELTSGQKANRQLVMNARYGR